MKFANEVLLYSPYNGATGDPHGADFEPGDNGLQAWTYDGASRPMVANSVALASNSVYMMKVKVAAAGTVNNVVLAIAAHSVTTTPTSATVAIYNNSGTKVGESASITTTLGTAGSTNAILTIPMSSGVAVTPGYYHVALRMTQTSGTLPTFYGVNAPVSTVDTGNAGLSNNAWRFCIGATGQTTMPGSITMASRVSANTFYTWAALS